MHHAGAKFTLQTGERPADDTRLAALGAPLESGDLLNAQVKVVTCMGEIGYRVITAWRAAAAALTVRAAAPAARVVLMSSQTARPSCWLCAPLPFPLLTPSCTASSTIAASTCQTPSTSVPPRTNNVFGADSCWIASQCMYRTIQVYKAHSNRACKGLREERGALNVLHMRHSRAEGRRSEAYHVL